MSTYSWLKTLQNSKCENDNCDNCALEDRVLLYPYIISEIRNREEE